MDDMERRVWREARAMTRREVITKQLSWVQASEILGISARHILCVISTAIYCPRVYSKTVGIECGGQMLRAAI